MHASAGGTYLYGWVGFSLLQLLRVALKAKARPSQRHNAPLQNGSEPPCITTHRCEPDAFLRAHPHPGLGPAAQLSHQHHVHSRRAHVNDHHHSSLSLQNGLRICTRTPVRFSQFLRYSFKPSPFYREVRQGVIVLLPRCVAGIWTVRGLQCCVSSSDPSPSSRPRRAGRAAAPPLPPRRRPPSSLQRQSSTRPGAASPPYNQERTTHFISADNSAMHPAPLPFSETNMTDNLFWFRAESTDLKLSWSSWKAPRWTSSPPRDANTSSSSSRG